MYSTIEEFHASLECGNRPPSFHGVLDTSDAYRDETTELMVFTIHDHTGSLSISCEEWWYPHYEEQDGNLVNLWPRSDKDHVSGQPIHLEPIIDVEGRPNGIRHLRGDTEQTANLLARMVGLRDRLRTPSFQVFLDRVLGPTGHGLEFLQAPASTKYHHREVGGLLKHSVEVAEAVEAAIGILSVGPLQADSAIVTALIHDLGKLAPQGPDKDLVPFMSDEHDRLIEYSAAEALLNLRMESSEAYHALLYLIKGFEHGDWYNCPLAALIRACDATSARGDVVQRGLSRRKTDSRWLKVRHHRPIYHC